MPSFVNWNFEQDHAVYGDWVKDENGNLVPPALLKTVSTANDELAILQSLLKAFGIPNVCQFPKEVRVTPVVIGAAGVTAEVYVPETMLEDAQNIINTNNIENIEEDE